jgi:histidinol-phosphate aminotransferase
MALASLNALALVERQVKTLIEERQKMERELLAFGFVKKIYPSDANFILIQVDDAQKRYDQFLEQGIVVRNRSSLLGCENTLRITIGTTEENITFINVCKSIDQ